MSGQASGWVLRHGPHPEHLDRDGRAYGSRARGLRSALLVVADAANAEGQHAHPGTDAVAEGALYSRRQAVSLLDELEAEGWLQVEERGGGRGRATVYRVVMVERVKGATTATSGPETVQPEELKGAAAAAERVQSEPETMHPGLHPNGVTTTPRDVPPTMVESTSAFDAFWAAYPRHTDKGAARKAFSAASKKVSAATIIEGARQYAADPNREDAYTKHAATWLHAEAWDNPPLPARARYGMPDRYQPPPVASRRDLPAGPVTDL